MKWWWLSCTRFTVGVATNADKVIIDGAPIVRKFIGQPIGNLSRWMQGIGGFKWAAPPVPHQPKG